jgi:hypothetical protein
LAKKFHIYPTFPMGMRQKGSKEGKNPPGAIVKAPSGNSFAYYPAEA